MTKLFSPIQIKSISFKNRIVVSPMCQYSATDGFATDWHLVHLGSRAVGGAGLIIAEATAVTPEGRISPYDLGLWKDEHIDGLKRITQFIEQQGCVPGIQLAHAGRKSSMSAPWMGNKLVAPADGGWETVAPSAIPFSDDYSHPSELTVEGIARIVKGFKDAARRALAAGFKVIEIHGAHGYLVNEFLSPLTNQRNDEYGGSFENRLRFLMEVIAAIQTEWPADLPLFLRISATDWAEGGWTVEDSVKLATILKDKGIDVIDCSTGGVVSYAKMTPFSGYQVEFAAAVRKAGIATGAVGIITTAAQAEEILQNEQADLIFMARELLRDPYFPLRAARDLDETAVSWPVQYERAKRKK